MKDIVYVRDLVERLGSKNAAAKYLDCTSSTMQKLYRNNAVFINGELYTQSSSRAKLPGGRLQVIKIGTRAWADDSRKIVRAVKKVVRVQAIGDCEETAPYQKLFLGVFEQALDDAIAGHANCERSTAIKYLNGEMPHLVALGIEPEWVKRIIVQIGLKARINEVANFYGEKGW